VLLVVGLGNPGREHEGSRHNVGFMVVDALRRSEGWPDFRPKFSGSVTQGELSGTGAAVAILKPHTYMNLSGDSVQPAAAFLKVQSQNIVVVHDELDLPWREVRLKVGGGHAGHNGLRSIIQRVGPDFVRVRVGIGKPPAGFRGDGAEWVLSSFEPIERAELPGVLDVALSAIRRVVRDGVAAAANVVNRTSAGRH
jgi:PTH1 family peptidyl-tRNA hydrolase